MVLVVEKREPESQWCNKRLDRATENRESLETTTTTNTCIYNGLHPKRVRKERTSGEI